MPGYDLLVNAVSDTSVQTTRLYFGADLDEADDKMVFWDKFTLEAFDDYRIIRKGFRQGASDPVPFGIPMRLPVRIGEGDAQIDIEDRVRAIPVLEEALQLSGIYPPFRKHALRLRFWKGEGEERRIITGFDYPMLGWFEFPPSGGTYALVPRAERIIDQFGNAGYDRFTNFYNGVPVERALREAGIAGNSLLGLEVTIDIGTRPDPGYFFDPVALDSLDPTHFLSPDERYWLEVLQHWETLVPPRTQYDPPATAGDIFDGFQPNPWPYYHLGPIIPPAANPNFQSFEFWAKRQDGLIDPTTARLQIDGTIDTILLQTLTIETRYQQRLEAVRLFEVDGRQWILASMARRERGLMELSLQAVRETAPAGN